jgi:hypothetical protein
MKTFTRTLMAILLAMGILALSAGTAAAGFGQMDGYGTPGPQPNPWADINVVCQDGYADVVYDFGNSGDAATTVSIHHWTPDGVVQHETPVGPNSVHQFVHTWTENHELQTYVVAGGNVVASADVVIDCEHEAPTVTLDTQCPHFGFTLHNNDAQWAHFASTVDGLLNGAFPVVAPLTSMPYIIAGVEDTPVHVLIEGARAPGEPLVVLFDEMLVMDCLGDPVQWPNERPDRKPVERPEPKPFRLTSRIGGLSFR